MESYMSEAFVCNTERDEVIWCIFKKGNKQAFAVLYQRYFKILFQYGLRRAGDRDLVKDCIHDLFVDIWKNKENLSEPNSVKAYLLSAIQRKLSRQINKFRSQQNNIAQMMMPLLVNCKEDQMIEDQIELEQNHSVNKALNALTKREREAIYLKFYSNLSYKEVAAKMAITVESTYNLISAGIDSLYAELNKVPVQKL
jgi:RNA polymerase sigma factor (sigma-70 family)